jgi:hypothetical protein
MPYRSFRDSSGVDWAAWDVVPQSTERRRAQRRQRSMSVNFPERRRTERRTTAMRRPTLSHGFAGGWLCFEGRAERRRLTPIPPDWDRCGERQLEEYCRQARPAGARKTGSEV